MTDTTRLIRLRAYGDNSTDWPGMHYFTLNDGNWCKRSRDLIVMECVGVDDRGGRRAYDGDIITPYMQDNSQETVIIYRDCYKFQMNEVGYEDGGGGLWYFDFVIIGNIHENPELLEKSND